MDDRRLEQVLHAVGRERMEPHPELVCRTKDRLRRSRLLPGIVFGSLVLQFLTVCVSVFVLTTDALSLEQKIWGFAGASFLIALFLLPLVAVKEQIRVVFEESDRTIQHC